MNIIQKIEKGEFELYLHPKQKDRLMRGADLYEHLKEDGLLDDCATLEDLKEIQKQGIEFYKKHFCNNCIFAWKSVQLNDGSLNVPYLYEDGDKVVLRWFWANIDWIALEPALRFASNFVFDSTLDLALETVKKAGYEVKKKTYFITGQGQVMDNNIGNKLEKRRKFLGSYASKEDAEKVVKEITEKYGDKTI